MMEDLNNNRFSIERTVEILKRTPETLISLTGGLSDFWSKNNEGIDTWSVFDVVGHLLHGDKTDWLVRTKIILSDSGEKKFQPFDRFAQFETNKGKTLQELLNEFKLIRDENIRQLRSLEISTDDLAKTGTHPAFGAVTLSQLLSAWAVHDLNHIAQISRIMSKQYKEETGPWIEYLRILKS